jgi:hypothetical protein
MRTSSSSPYPDSESLYGKRSIFSLCSSGWMKVMDEVSFLVKLLERFLITSHLIDAVNRSDRAAPRGDFSGNFGGAAPAPAGVSGSAGFT